MCTAGHSSQAELQTLPNWDRDNRDCPTEVSRPNEVSRIVFQGRLARKHANQGIAGTMRQHQQKGRCYSTNYHICLQRCLDRRQMQFVVSKDEG